MAEVDLGIGLRALLGRQQRHRPGPGAGYFEWAIRAPLGDRLLPPPSPRRVAVIASWEDDAALDEFFACDPLGSALAGGWHARFLPLRVFGAWPRMPGLPDPALPDDPEE